MKAIKVFENAKVVSVNNGEIWVEVNSEIKKYKKAALVSVNNGVVKIEYEVCLTEEILENGRIVEYRDGQRKLVLKKPDGHAIVVGTNSYASEPLTLSGDCEIVKVYKGTFSGKLETMLNSAYELVWQK